MFPFDDVIMKLYPASHPTNPTPRDSGLYLHGPSRANVMPVKCEGNSIILAFHLAASILHKIFSPCRIMNRGTD